MSSREKSVMVENGLNRFVLVLSGIMALPYLIFGPIFAKWHLEIAAIPFPVFIGEIFLTLCLVLSLVKMGLTKTAWKPFHGLLAAYIIFILAKAGAGYVEWGPLALRHAALFYYPLFAVIGYYFFDRSFFTPRAIALCAAAVFLGLWQNGYCYSVFPLLFAGLLLGTKIRPRWMRYVFSVALLSVALYGGMFGAVRTKIVAEALGLVCFCVLAVNVAWTGRRNQKLVFLLVFVCGLSLVISRVADPNAVRSMISPQPLLEKWDRLSQQIAAGRKRDTLSPGSVRLFNDDYFPEHKTAGQKTGPERKVTLQGPPVFTDIVRPGPGSPASSCSQGGRDSAATALEDNAAQEQAGEENILTGSAGLLARSLDTAENNILFRLFIWRDMLRELGDKKPFWGMPFGYPFSSRSLMTLGWGQEIWRVDGWVAAHNSYLEILFRAGIIGIVLVGALFWFVIRMIKAVLKRRDWAGVFLASIIVYWLTAACFGVFFELPYNAIVFWLLFGMTAAYLFKPGRNNENTDRA